ncbi:MAG: hypothetical protein AAGI30_05825 [Planctomycetota bacterium]
MTRPTHLLAGVALTALALPALAPPVAQDTEPADAPADVAVTDMPTDLAEVRDALSEAWDKLESYTADLAFTIVPPTGQPPQSLTGSITAKIMNGDSNVMRTHMEMGGVVSMGPISATISRENLFDGEFIYSLETIEAPVLPEPQVKAEKSRPEPDKKMDARSVFDAMLSEYVVERLDDESGDGMEFFVLKATPKPGSQAMQAGLEGDQIVYFDQATGVVTRMQTQSATGSLQFEMKLHNIETNVDVDESIFVFEVPDGVEVVDRTAG